MKELKGFRFKYFVYVSEKEFGIKNIFKITLICCKENGHPDDVYYLVEYDGGRYTLDVEQYKFLKEKYPMIDVVLG